MDAFLVVKEWRGCADGLVEEDGEVAEMVVEKDMMWEIYYQVLWAYKD